MFISQFNQSINYDKSKLINKSIHLFHFIKQICLTSLRYIYLLKDLFCLSSSFGCFNFFIISSSSNDVPFPIYLRISIYIV